MKIYLAGDNGKRKILALYESILGIRHYKTATVLSSVSAQTDRQTDRQTEARNENLPCRRIEWQPITPIPVISRGGNLKEAGNGYHKTDEFLTEAEQKMRVFLAGNGYHKTDEFEIRRMVEDVTNFKDFNILESYYMLRDNEDFLHLLTRCNSFLIDSGAFTFMQGTHQGEIDWDEYIEQYADMINRWDIKLFFELDIETIIGLPEVERLRAKLEKLTNKQCIPVWHIQRGKDYYIRMCQEYPYVALGGLVGKILTGKIPEEYYPWFINTAHQYGAKIHGLGYTSVAGLHKYRFDSVDSTAWLAGNRGGFLYKFIPATGTMKQLHKEDGHGRLKARAAALHNFMEWVKFSKYAEQNL